METMEARIGKMEAELQAWGVKLDELIARAGEAGAETKDGARRHIADLKSKHRDAARKLEELRAAGSEKWESFKIDAESAWTELEIAFRILSK